MFIVNNLIVSPWDVEFKSLILTLIGDKIENSFGGIVQLFEEIYNGSNLIFGSFGQC